MQITNMEIKELENREEYINQLVSLWERTVLLTHHFLTKNEIDKIKEYVPNALASVKHLIICQDNNKLLGFMGIENEKLEMLFIDINFLHQGFGKSLIEYAKKYYGLKELTVNEQNHEAVGFYKHMGFIPYKRTEYDEEGNPYPLIYMKLEG